MPTYDYRCEANKKIYEVKHPMSQSLSTWAELCELAGMEMKNIPASTPVTKVLSSMNVVKPTSLKSLRLQLPCKADGCGGGACMM